MQLAIVGYRKLSFARKFGFTVRDLMFLKALEASDNCSRIDWFERPDLPHEALAGLTHQRYGTGGKVTPHVGVDLNMAAAAIRGRAWSATSLRAHDNALKTLLPGGIILDFHPFYIPPLETVIGQVYWYDLIDNFEKHNRFSVEERKAVARKYEFVRKHAKVVTGVTSAAITSFPNSFCIPNKLLQQEAMYTDNTPEFDFGFLGFITDKFDVEFVRRLCDAGHSVLVAGHAYDPRTLEQLKAIPNLTYWGPFTSLDAPKIIAKFYVGLVPYIIEKMHDESPIKFFQYISNGRSAVLPKKFNDIEDDFRDYVHYYDRTDITPTTHFLNSAKSGFAVSNSKLRERAMAHPEIFWESAIDGIIERVLDFPASQAVD